MFIYSKFVIVSFDFYSHTYTIHVLVVIKLITFMHSFDTRTVNLPIGWDNSLV